MTKKQPPETFGSRLAQARRELAVALRKDILARDIAEAVGVTSATYSRWESGEITPRRDMIERLAVFLRVSPGFLLFGEASNEDGSAPVMPVTTFKPAPSAATKKGRKGA